MSKTEGFEKQSSQEYCDKCRFFDAVKSPIVVSDGKKQSPDCNQCAIGYFCERGANSYTANSGNKWYPYNSQVADCNIFSKGITEKIDIVSPGAERLCHCSDVNRSSTLLKERLRCEKKDGLSHIGIRLEQIHICSSSAAQFVKEQCGKQIRAVFRENSVTVGVNTHYNIF